MTDRRRVRGAPAGRILLRSLLAVSLMSTATVSLVKAAPIISDQDLRRQADKLFEIGKKAWAAGDWSTACANFEQSFQLDASPSTLVKIARCFARADKLTRALGAYRQARELNARRQPSDVHAYQLDRLIRDEVALLAPRVPLITFTIAPDVAGRAVNVDELPIAPAELDAPWAVDAGIHEVIVRAPGFFPQHRRVELVEGQRFELAVVLEPAPRPSTPNGPAPGPVRAVLPHPMPLATGQPDAPATLELASTPWRRSARSVTAMTLGAAGLAGLVTGAYFAVRTVQLVNRADCDQQHACSAAGLETTAEALRTQTKGLVAASVGAGLIATGTILWLTRRTTPPRPPARVGSSLQIGLVSDRVWIGASW